ncbi:hypothetical protein QVD17_05544 [Tagetes erecta]|uniref:Uncharacterized protein n=1 Tax=Tagetes erecta TaxID=13708 RepID=A0AAD8LC71_TARER|nr:hypothetical protein QVD17_05544 [Tagetes erecta]
MARLIDVGDDGRGEMLEFEGSHIVFVLCMILVSMSVLSIVIFVCGDHPADNEPTQEGQSSNKEVDVVGGSNAPAVVGGGGGGGNDVGAVVGGLADGGRGCCACFDGGDGDDGGGGCGGGCGGCGGCGG